MKSWTDHSHGIQLPTAEDLTIPAVTPEDAHHAALTVCELAVSREDAGMLLAMLGLVS